MPIYVYRCECGLRFERLLPHDAEPPKCPQCGGATRKLPAASSLGGRAGTAPAKDRLAAPKDRLAPPWRAMAGNPERIQREVEFRQRLEAKHVGDNSSGESGRAADGG